MNLIDFANELQSEGLNPLPLKDNKAPMLEAGHNFLYEPIDNIEKRFANAQKIGIACGLVSQFYCIDFDAHNEENISEIYNDFITVPFITHLIKQGILSCYTTAGGGYHVYFRSKDKINGQVFAKYSTGSTMVELRGHGQYAACYPSAGYTHTSGNDYIKLEYYEDDIDNLFDFIKSYNQHHSVSLPHKNTTDKKWAETWKLTTPDGKYNLECEEEAKDLLRGIGWQFCKTRADGSEYWTRPNKDIKDGFSATFGHQKSMFYIFSEDGSSIHPFKAKQSYSPFNIYTLIKHDNNWKEAKEALNVRYNMTNDDFWSTTQNGAYILNNFKFKQFLNNNDFFKNSPEPNGTFQMIKKEGIFLNQVFEKDVKDFVLDYIETNNKPEGVYNLMSGNLKFFKREFLGILKNRDISLLKDTKECAYLFYTNCIVKITENQKEILSYSDMDLSIWRDQVISRDFVKVDHHKSEFRTFIWNISGKDRDKYKAFQTVIGYLLHSYKDRSNNKAIIFNDEAISDVPNGRSGKGLFWNAMGHLKKVQSLDGKLFDFQDKFPYQNVSTDCQILVFDDVKKRFNFENLFSVITEGITIEYKGKDSIKLDVTNSPKIIITTNYTISGNSASFNARKYEVEMANTFSDKFTPVDLFGHELFNDWDDHEWSKFDNYCQECIQIYLNKGLIAMPTKNLEYRKILDDISAEMYFFFEDLKANTFYSVKEELFDSFNSRYPEKKSYTTQNKITINFRKWCEYKGYEPDDNRNGGSTKLSYIIPEKKEQVQDIWDELTDKSNNINN
jgi:hypothetical protein